MLAESAHSSKRQTTMTNDESASSLVGLFPELQTGILSYLTGRHLLQSAACVCKLWTQLAHSSLKRFRIAPQPQRWKAILSDCAADVIRHTVWCLRPFFQREAGDISHLFVQLHFNARSTRYPSHPT